MAKMYFGDYLKVGLKALGGDLITAFVVFIVYLLLAFIMGGFTLMERPVLGLMLGLFALLLNITLRGFVFNKFWNWK